MRQTLLVAFAIAVLLGGAGWAQVTKGEIDGVRNYSRVDATVGCGGAVDPAAMRALRGEGYVSVVNLRLASEAGADIEKSRDAAQAAGLKYIHLPLDAAAPDSAVVDRFLAAVSDKANQPVFIHCGSANRVGAVWMIKRALQDGWALDRARAEAEAIGLRSQALDTFATDYIAKHR